MVMINLKGKKIYFNNYLKTELDIILKEAIPNNWDAVILIFGREGSGKSTLAMQIATYLDKTTTVDDVAFVPEDFITKVKTFPEEKSLVWDEAIAGGKAQQHATMISQDIIDYLSICRKKKMKIIICFPHLNMLHKYFVTRCLCSIYVYATGLGKHDRGNAIFYNSKQTEYLYELMKRKYWAQPFAATKEAAKCFNFHFPKDFIINKKEYDKRKDMFIEKARTKGKKDLWKSRSAILLKYLKDNKIMTITEAAKIIGTTRSNLSNIMMSVRPLNIY